MPYLLIIGAKSDIAKAAAIEYAKNGFDLYLAARNCQVLTNFAQDLQIKTERTIQLLELDILAYNSHFDFYQNLPEKPQGVLSAVGYLGNQKQAETDFIEAQRIIDTNYTGIVSLFNLIAADFEQRKKGFIIGISSVAGDRGRKKNYLYGSAKAAFTAYLSGLRNRLHCAKVTVLTVKPGFVATKMTEKMALPPRLTAQPDTVAKAIYQAQQNHKNILYTKKIWYWIMLIIRFIPEWQFKKMDI